MSLSPYFYTDISLSQLHIADFSLKFIIAKTCLTNLYFNLSENLII